LFFQQKAHSLSQDITNMASADLPLFSFSKEGMKELKFQHAKLTLRASSLADAVNTAEVRANEAAVLLKQLKEKYAASQEYLHHLNSLITKASEENAAVITKVLADDMEIPRVTPGNSKPDAPTLIRAVLEMHFSDKVNMNSFSIEKMNDSEEPVLCVVEMKEFGLYLEIWYNADDSMMIGGRMVVCPDNHCSYTTVGELKVAITSAFTALC
jgi:hypothetical protein